VCADEGQIELQVDEARDPSPMNCGQRMARIALGAALENLLRTAARHGWTTEVERPPGRSAAIVRLQPPRAHFQPVENVIGQRVTNRRLYDGRPVPDEVLSRLTDATPVLEDVGTHWIV